MGEAKRKRAFGEAFDHRVVADNFDASTKVVIAALKGLKRDYAMICAAMRIDDRVSRKVIAEAENRIQRIDLVMVGLDHDDMSVAMRMLDPRHPSSDLVRIH